MDMPPRPRRHGAQAGHRGRSAGPGVFRRCFRQAAGILYHLHPTVPTGAGSV